MENWNEPIENCSNAEEEETTELVELSLEDKLLAEDNMDSLKEIAELFNVNMKKKEILRASKLNDLQDKVVDHMIERVEMFPDDLSNRDLLDYHKTIQNTLTNTDTSFDNVKTPTIQVNQQININNNEFDRDSREKILDAVHAILAQVQDTESDEEG